MTATTQHEESTAGAADRLLMAIELGRRQWNVGFTTRLGHRIRRRRLPADAWDRLPEEIAAAKKRLALPADASAGLPAQPLACKLLILKTRRDVRVVEGARLEIDSLARADAHRNAPTPSRSTTSRNNDRLQRVPVNDGVAPGFRGVCDTVLTQNSNALRTMLIGVRPYASRNRSDVESAQFASIRAFRWRSSPRLERWHPHRR